MTEDAQDSAPANPSAVDGGQNITTIAGYFAAPSVSPSMLFKALRTAKIRRFSDSDEADALRLMGEVDSSGEKLWALAAQRKLPEAVDRWIWNTSRDRLSKLIWTDLDPMIHEPTMLLKGLVTWYGQQGKSGSAVASSTNWLRIAIRWLIEKRSLDPWVVGDTLRPVFFKKEADAASFVQDALKRGRSVEFRQAIATTGFARLLVEAATRERDSEKRNSTVAQEKLTKALREIDDLRWQLSSASEKLDAAIAARIDAETKLDHERQHSGHDLSATKAQQRSLLRGRIAPLLSDAVDALEIEPPAPQAALARLKAAILAIEEIGDE